MKNITAVIVTYHTSKQVILNCIKSIDKNIQILIVENSEKFKNSDEICSQFKNVEIVCTGKNLGYGGGNNIGLMSAKTDYVLILNPDVICDKDFFENISSVIDQAKDFSIIGCQYLHDKVFMPAGFFDTKKNLQFVSNFKSNNINTLTKVDWVTGCSMLINTKNFENKKIFDENFFLYFEEFDLCKSLMKKNNNVFTSKILKIHHLGFESSSGEHFTFKRNINRLREWHWMWSTFYFYKKNFNYFYALKKIIGKFIKSFFKMIYYSITFQKNQKEKYTYRFLGIFNAILCRPSKFRGGFN
jgi:N-acetylglucosaminyl-diphospho-decaprenol L-rhamnosyltransferase